MTTAISSFRETGICLMYTKIFQEHDLLSSTATVIDLNVSVTRQEIIKIFLKVCSQLDQKFNPKYTNKSSTYSLTRNYKSHCRNK